MSVRSWTQGQRQAINASGGGILVSAAAGSGKTAVLVERVIRLITREDNPVPADRLLIVTFTKAAAAEMKQRISAALAEKIADNPINLHYKEQQILLSRAHICTIHAFCSELLRDHFEQLSIAPDFRIADEAEIGLLKQAAVDRVLEESYEEGNDNFIMLSEFFSSRTDRLLSEQMLLIYEFIRSHPFPLHWLDEQENIYRNAVKTGELPWMNVVIDEALEALDYGKTLIASALKMMDGDTAMADCYRSAFESDRQFLSELAGLLREGRWDEAISGAENYAFPKLKGLRNYDDAPKKEAVSQLRQEAKDVLVSVKELLLRCGSSHEILKDLKTVIPIMEALFNAVKRMYELLEEEKKAKNVLDFSDLELLALHILARPDKNGFLKTELAYSYESSFEEILVDEYQDINEVQDMIFRALSRKEQNLFLVGDVKQSIYRFRKAMPELFLQRSENAFPYDGDHYPAKIKLDANFRSRTGVTEAVNFIFETLMSRNFGDVDYSQERLNPMAKFEGKIAGEAQLHIIDYAQTEVVKEDRVTCEARHIAYEIRRMVAQGMQINDHGKLRRCRFSDFCILLRSMKDRAILFEDEFKRQGIPLWSDVSAGYFDSEEVVIVLSLLKILDNPLQDVALLSVLFSPFYSFTPDEIAEIRLCARTEPFYIALKLSAEQGNTKALKFLCSIEQFRIAGANVRLDELLQLIYDTTGFMAFVGASQNGEQRTANLRLLLEYARRYEKAGYRGISGFIRFVDQTMERGRDLDAANVINEKADVVRLMSIHRSKGLEFPVCFVADLGKQFNKFDLRGELLLHPDKGIGFKIREPQTLKRYTTLPYEALRCSIVKDLLSEELRVLYVALTRPKEKLILVLSCKNLQNTVQKTLQKNAAILSQPYVLRGMRSFGEWIMAAMMKSCELYNAVNLKPTDEVMTCKSGVDVCVYPPITEMDADELEIEDHSQVNFALLTELKKTLSYHYPYEEISKLPGKMTVTQLAKGVSSGEIVLSKPSFLFERKFTAAERGTILHRFMQHIDLNTVSVNEEIKRQIAAMFLSEEQAAALNVKSIENFLMSEIAQKMRNAEKSLYREYKFMYEMNASELYDISGTQDETVLIQGVADAVIAEKDGLTIIDYKTDRVGMAEELDQRYRTQLELYGKALSKSFGCPIKEKVIYSFALSKEIDLNKLQ